ncbi:hypothetical protein BDV29DRAFT_161697 [Aspergillus leporis]|uniref:Uncharacterized protein n=1 Tax=Aspergillus leporis TaxID=41062 RepID=A0A5N5WKU1_9EURO|nr:hypothetical protein BDV29DRAFT_161697 [Aspergillus leporis]
MIGGNEGEHADTEDKEHKPQDQADGSVTGADSLPKGPWGDRGVTSPKAGSSKPRQKESSLNVRINLDLRADVALELHAVIQGDVTIGLF